MQVGLALIVRNTPRIRDWSLAVACALAFASPASAQSYTLTINTLGSGSVSASPAGPYASDTLVTLTATPASGWSLSSWSGNLTGYANPATVIMKANFTVTATFDQDGYRGVTGDSRTVTEPTFPPACTVLQAQQSASSLNQRLFDTSLIQAAINSCPAGQAVELSSSGTNNAFLTQPIVVKAGVTLLIDADVTLLGSNNKADYNCNSTCVPLIQVASNAAPSPGSGIMGYGIIDGQGSAFWGSDPRPRLIYVGDPTSHASSDNFTLYKVTLQNAPQFNVYAISKGLTIWGVKVRNPGNSPNTDGIDPSGSTNVTIRDSYISTGDDHIAIKAGIGHVSNVTIAHNHLYYGHGLSMGSETNAGIDNVLATDNVIDQAGCVGCTSSNDIRIKSDVSRGGEVKNILYQDTCIRNATKQAHEFVFDPFYTSTSGSLIPYFHDIYLHNVHMVDAGGKSTFRGYDASRVLTMFFDNVVWDAFSSSDFSSAYTQHAAFTMGPGPVSFATTLTAKAASDVDVTVTNSVSTANSAYDCAGRFVYLAGELFAATRSVAGNSPLALTSILQPAIYGAASPTGTISILEGSAVVATASISSRVVPLTVPNVSPGTHTYTASYSGDSIYAQLYYGSETVTATGSGGADFAMSSTPSSNTVTAGGGTVYTAAVTPSGGFTGSVSLSVSGLPNGATASFTPSSLGGPGSSNLSVATNSTTPAGSYPLLVTGTGGGFVHSTTVVLIVKSSPVPDFAISAGPSSQTVMVGTGASYTATVTALSGFAGTVTFSVTGLPNGAIAVFNPTSVNGSGTSALSVTTSSSTPAGIYGLTITGISGGLTHTTTVSLVVQGSGSSDFSVSASPTTQSVDSGHGVKYTVTVAAMNGFAGKVAFGVTGAPTGATAVFSPSSVNGAGSSTLTVGGQNLKTGSYTLTIAGASGTLRHTTAVTLVVK